MGRFHRPRLIAIAAYLVVVAAIAAVVWWSSYVSALAQLEQRARSDLALATNTLTGELRRFRELAVVAADHPQLLALAQGRIAPDGLSGVLQEIADKSGALDMMLVDTQGRPILTTEDAPEIELGGRAYFERAMDGALGFSHLYRADAGQRAFVVAAPLFAPEGPVVAALVVHADVEAVEASWRSASPVYYFTNRAGVIFLANRSELILRARLGDPVQGDATGPDVTEQLPFVHYATRQISTYELWDVDGGRYLPRRALHLTQDVPVIDMTAEVLVDVAPARKLAGLQAAVTAAVFLAFGALWFLATERRRTLAALNTRLEARVADRTAALSALNEDLRREVAERTAAETRLQKAQDDLVQAGKLSALGQMSAGISHELNQPLTAIRSFAENAQGFLERGQADVAAQNLGRISELARRMGRIIRNLRAFARQEDEPPADVDIVGVIDAVLEIVGPRAALEGVNVRWDRPNGPMIVRGGEVRLQQVILNLVTNGMDAMEASDERIVTVTLSQSGARTVVSVRDTGPGISEPEKIFDPFYTTKAIGAAEGMGLGLSISYGLVQSFGGAIRGRNHPDGGAVFTVELNSVAEKVAA